jgi:hypothetical protein
VWPANLTFTYPRWQVSQSIWWQYLYPLAVLAAIGAAWWMRRRSRAPLAALLFFGVTLGPALGFVNVYPFRYSFVADHFQYLAAVGIMALAAAGVVWAAGRWAKPLPNASVWLAVVLLVPLALVTHRDSQAYANIEALYSTTIERNPTAWLAVNRPRCCWTVCRRSCRALALARDAAALAPNEASTPIQPRPGPRSDRRSAGATDAYRRSIARATDSDRRTVRVALVHQRLAG